MVGWCLHPGMTLSLRFTPFLNQIISSRDWVTCWIWKPIGYCLLLPYPCYPSHRHFLLPLFLIAIGNLADITVQLSPNICSSRTPSLRFSKRRLVMRRIKKTFFNKFKSIQALNCSPETFHLSKIDFASLFESASPYVQIISGKTRTSTQSCRERYSLEQLNWMFL